MDYFICIETIGAIFKSRRESALENLALHQQLAMLRRSVKRLQVSTTDRVFWMLSKLNSHTELSVPIHVVHGKRDGPHLFVSVAIHGDEVNGVEIILRLLELRALRRMSGTSVLRIYSPTAQFC